MDNGYKTYSERIKNANPLELTIINYELLILELNNAKTSILNSPQQNDSLKKATAFLSELYVSLDINIELASQLANLFMFVNKKIIHVSFAKTEKEKDALLNDALSIVSGLLSTWQSLTHDFDVFLRSTERLSGFTYDKDGNIADFESTNPSSDYSI